MLSDSVVFENRIRYEAVEIVSCCIDVRDIVMQMDGMEGRLGNMVSSWYLGYPGPSVSPFHTAHTIEEERGCEEK